MLYGVSVYVMINGADKDGFGCADDDQYGEKGKEEKDDARNGVYEPAYHKADKGSTDDEDELYEAKAEGGGKAFSPFFFHEGGRAFECIEGAQIFIGYHGYNKKGGRAPYDPYQGDDEFADAAQVILQHAQQRTYRGGECCPCENMTNTAHAELQPFPDGYFLSIKIKVRTMDQGRIKKDDNKIVYQVIQENENIIQDTIGIRVTQVIEIPACGGKKDEEK